MSRNMVCGLVVLGIVSASALAAEPRQGPVTLLQEKDNKIFFKPSPNKSSVAVLVTDDTKFIDSQGKVHKGKEIFKKDLLTKMDQITVWANDKDEASTIWFGQHKDEKEPKDK
jgi:hypothetical protein